MSIEGKCEKCGGATTDYRCLNCVEEERDKLLLQVDGLKKDLDYHENTCQPEQESHCKEIERLNLQVEELQKKLAAEEADHEKTFGERDHWEEVISGLADDAGCKEEWSNLHAHGDCITNLWDAKVKEASKFELQVEEARYALAEIYALEGPGLDGSSENASGRIARLALENLKKIAAGEMRASEKRRCPSTYTHSRLGRLVCEKDEAHLHRRGDVEHQGGGVKWMSV